MIDQIYGHQMAENILPITRLRRPRNWPWRRGLRIKVTINKLLATKNNGHRSQFGSRRVTRTDGPTIFSFSVSALWTPPGAEIDVNDTTRP